LVQEVLWNPLPHLLPGAKIRLPVGALTTVLRGTGCQTSWDTGG
jgi:hypothetical protein